MLSGLLLIDIETVPMVQALSDLEPQWQSLFCHKISKTVPEPPDLALEWRKKAGILAEFGRIICLSVGFLYQDDAGEWCLKLKSLAGDDEVEILDNFTRLCERMEQIHPTFRFAGHNIREFDIPYICRRMLINHLPLPQCLRLHDRKPWERPMFDTMGWWKFGDHKNYVSLSLLTQVLGIPSPKHVMDGSMVQDVYYLQQDLPAITRYCEDDVTAVANIILRYHQLPLLKPNNIIRVSNHQHSAATQQ